MNNTATKLRSLRPKDLDRVVDIDRRIIGRSRRRFFEKRLAAALADNKGFVAAAATDPDDLVSGYAIARMQNGEFGGDHRIAVIDVIGVDPDARRSGSGSLIVEWIADQAVEAGATELRTQIDWQNRNLIHFFSGAGFQLAPYTVLECEADDIQRMRSTEEYDPFVSNSDDVGVSHTRIDADIPDYSDSGGDDYHALSRDRVPVRSMGLGDLDTVIRIDAKFTGRERRDYYEAKLREVMTETGIRVSLVAEADDLPVGYVMARVDYGEFGRAEPTAVIDTIGVHPGFGHHGVASALMSQLLVNLEAIHIATVRTNVSWNNFSLLNFLGKSGFAPAQRLVLSRMPNDERPLERRANLRLVPDREAVGTPPQA
jgi:ribosomal protein S18 acetylase RimI-like enzyme